MRKKGEAKVFSEMEGLYSRERYLGGIREFEECNGLSSRRI